MKGLAFVLLSLLGLFVAVEGFQLKTVPGVIWKRVPKSVSRGIAESSFNISMASESPCFLVPKVVSLNTSVGATENLCELRYGNLVNKARDACDVVNSVTSIAPPPPPKPEQFIQVLVGFAGAIVGSLIWSGINSHEIAKTNDRVDKLEKMQQEIITRLDETFDQIWDTIKNLRDTMQENVNKINQMFKALPIQNMDISWIIHRIESGITMWQNTERDWAKGKFTHVSAYAQLLKCT